MNSVIEGVIAALVLIFLFYGAWQSFIVEISRQRLFEIRDSIFDQMVAGDFSPSDESYKEIRNTFNSLIRFCHNTTLLRMIVFKLVLKSVGFQSPSYPETLIKDPVLKQVIDEKLKEAFRLIIIQMCIRSFIFLIFMPLVVPVIFILAINPRDNIALTEKKVSCFIYTEAKFA